MKKIIGLLIILFVFTTGCSKKLICTKTDNNDLIKTEETFIIGYKNEKISSVQITLNSEVQKGYESYTEKVEENLKEQFTKYEKIKGVRINSGSRDNQIKVEVFIELDQLSEKEKKKLNFINLEENEKELKKTLEKNKYQCSK